MSTNRERLASRYAGREFADDEELYGASADELSQYDDDAAHYIEDTDRYESDRAAWEAERAGYASDRAAWDAERAGYEAREASVREIFDRNPRGAEWFLAMGEGKDPVEYLVRTYGHDIVSSLDDPSKQEALAQAQADYLKRVAEQNQFESEYKSNIESTQSSLAVYQEREGLSEEEMDRCVGELIDLMHNIIVGIITPEMIEMVRKAGGYADAVAAAREEGEVLGRNRKIEAKLRKRGGDGQPQLGTSNSVSKVASRPRQDLGALGAMSEGKSIWDKG